MSYQHVLVKQALEGETVAHFMRRQIVTAPPWITVEELVENYIYSLHHKLFPVMDGDRLLGCVTTQAVKATPRQAWSQKTVAEILMPPSADNTIAPDIAATTALVRMSQHGNSRLMVVDDSRLVGIVTLKDLLEFMKLKLELEGNGGPSPQRSTPQAGEAGPRGQSPFASADAERQKLLS